MNTYVVIDIETTGFSTDSEIIEIAALKIADGIIISTFQTLIKPSVPIPSIVKRLTSITDKMVENAPSIQETLPDLLKFIGDKPLVGHNISTFDIPFINRVLSNISNLQLQNSYEDTMVLAKRKVVLDNYKLETIAENFKMI